MDLKERTAALLARRPDLRQADMARIAEVSTPTVSDWANGNTKTMKPEPARRLSVYFGCDQNWLMTGVGMPNWRADGQPPTAHQDGSGSAAPSLRQALHAIRNQLTHARGDVSDAVGDALRLMARVPDSDRAFEEALKLLSDIPSR